MTVASPYTPSKDDVLILHALYEEQASIQAIIDDPNTAVDALEKAVQELEAINAKIDARNASFSAPSVSPTTDSTKTKFQPSNPFTVGPTPPKVIKLSDLKASHPSTNAPKHGGLWKDESDNKLIPFVGFDPDVKINRFTYNEAEQDYVLLGTEFDKTLPVLRGPSHVGQLRPTGVKASSKTMERCTTLSAPIQYNGTLPSTGDGETIKHRTYVAIIRREIIQRGMYCEFLIPDSAAPEGWDLFLKHGRFTLQEVKDHVARMITSADTFQLENLDWSGRLIRSSLHPELLGKVIQEVGVSASGPVTFIAAMKIVFSGEHFEQLDLLREEFKHLKLSDFPGEDIQAVNEKVKDILDRLDGADMLSLGDQLLINQVGLYEQSSAEHMRLWALSKYDKVVDFVNKCRFGDATKLRETLPSTEIITYETLADEANKKYHELVGRNRYPPAIRTKPVSDDSPVAMLAQVQQAITQGVLKDLKKAGVTKAANGKSDSKKKSDESSSKQSQPGAAGGTNGSGPSKKTVKKDDKLPSDFPQEGMAWRTHWPSYWPDGDKDKRVFKYMGRKYKWCRKCQDGKGRWMYHFSSGHDAWKSRQSTRASTDHGGTAGSGNPASASPCSKPSTPAASLAVPSNESDSDDDDDGWKPVRI